MSRTPSCCGGAALEVEVERDDKSRGHNCSVFLTKKINLSNFKLFAIFIQSRQINYNYISIFIPFIPKISNFNYIFVLSIR